MPAEDGQEEQQMQIALPKPDTDGGHVISTPVEEIVEEASIRQERAIAIVGDNGAVLTPEQCFNLSDHFNKAGEVLKRYHEDDDGV